MTDFYQRYGPTVIAAIERTHGNGERAQLMRNVAQAVFQAALVRERSLQSEARSRGRPSKYTYYYRLASELHLPTQHQGRNLSFSAKLVRYIVETVKRGLSTLRGLSSSEYDNPRALMEMLETFEPQGVPVRKARVRRHNAALQGVQFEGVVYPPAFGEVSSEPVTASAVPPAYRLPQAGRMPPDCPMPPAPDNENVTFLEEGLLEFVTGEEFDCLRLAMMEDDAESDWDLDVLDVLVETGSVCLEC